MTKSPNPDWKPGQKQEATVSHFSACDLDGFSIATTEERYLASCQLENEGFTADSPFREVEPGKDLDNGAMYKMMTWGITPRPVAFVSTMDKQGRTNVRIRSGLV
jgi:hypothetical protein